MYSHFVPTSGSPWFQVQTTQGISSPANANGFSIRKTFEKTQSGVKLEAGAYTRPLLSNVSTFSGLHISPSHFVVSSFCGLGCVFESQNRLTLSCEVDASCGFNDQNWLRLS
jgi:hypothetical protein